MNKKALMIVAALAVLAAGVIGSQTVFAQDIASYNPMDSLVQKIADKFNLNQDEVQAVFDEQHNEMKAQMEKKHGERLDELVAEGKITQDQKTLILNKMEELRKKHEENRDDFKNLDKEELHAKLENERAELEKWAKDNGIDPSYLMFHVKFEGKGFGGKHVMFIN